LYQSYLDSLCYDSLVTSYCRADALITIAVDDGESVALTLNGWSGLTLVYWLKSASDGWVGSTSIYRFESTLDGRARLT